MNDEAECLKNLVLTHSIIFEKLIRIFKINMKKNQGKSRLKNEKKIDRGISFELE